MKFIILGAGAIGCYVGGRLAHAGQSVTLVGRPRVLDALAVHGLTVTDLEGFKGHVAPTALRLAPSLHEAGVGVDGDGAGAGDDESGTVILLCVKGGGTEAAAREMAQVCKPGTTVVSLQNGVDNLARIHAHAPQMQALAGMVPYNVVMTAGSGAFRVHRATTGSLNIERTRDGSSLQIASLLNAAGLHALLSDNMRAVQWGKLLLNLNNPINALSDLPLQAQLKTVITAGCWQICRARRWPFWRMQESPPPKWRRSRHAPCPTCCACPTGYSPAWPRACCASMHRPARRCGTTFSRAARPRLTTCVVPWCGWPTRTAARST